MRYVIAFGLILVCGIAAASDWKTVRAYDARGRRVGGYTEYNRPGRAIERSYYDRSGKQLGKTVGPIAPKSAPAPQRPTFKPYVGPSSRAK